MSSRLFFLIACATAFARRACSSVHSPWRWTKLAVFCCAGGIGVQANNEQRMVSEGVFPVRYFAIRLFGPAFARLPVLMHALPITLPVAGRPDAVDAGRPRDACGLGGIE